MGLFTGLLLLPLAPVRGVVWVARQLANEADRQLYDEDRIRGELLQLELDFEDGKLSGHERKRAEDALFERLAIAPQRRAERAGLTFNPVEATPVAPQRIEDAWEEKADG
jgi:hypothetical protein